MDNFARHYTLSDFHPKATNDPEHIGLIPDGTRRWARKNSVSLVDAYLHAMQKISDYIDFLFDEGVRAISIYLSSTQNFKRAESEVSAFCMAEAKLCNDLLPETSKRHGVKVMIAGNTGYLPTYFKDALQRISLTTCIFSSARLYLCVAYNPLDELLKAFRLASHPEVFLHHLWVPEPVDIIIRTSGANLLSNFLPLQSGYARLYVIEKLFNDTEQQDLHEILEGFKKLVRKYGD